MSRALVNAPVEDEEIGAEEESAAAEAREWLKHNKPVPHEKLLADLGLTPDDFARMGRTPLPPFAPWRSRRRCVSCTVWRASHKPRRAT
jgi:hypothetical protein